MPALSFAQPWVLWLSPLALLVAASWAVRRRPALLRYARPAEEPIALCIPTFDPAAMIAACAGQVSAGKLDAVSLAGLVGQRSCRGGGEAPAVERLLALARSQAGGGSA